MQVRVLLFGALKDVLARGSDVVELADGTTVEQLLADYLHRTPQIASFADSLAIAVNREYAVASHVLHEGDEVALLPPVSGGAEKRISDERPAPTSTLVRLQREAIQADLLLSQLKSGEDGAVVVFDGIVRNNTRGRRTLYLDYEAYEEMALDQMRSLVVDAKRRFDVRDAALVHRLGRLEVGETSVWIGVASAHRAAAFEACRSIIDTLKKTVPIWKKEYFEDGAVWADGEPFPATINLAQGVREGAESQQEDGP